MYAQYIKNILPAAMYNLFIGFISFYLLLFKWYFQVFLIKYTAMNIMFMDGEVKCAKKGIGLLFKK